MLFQASCLFHRFGPNTLTQIYEGLNFFIMAWTVLFVWAMCELSVAGAFSEWYWAVDKSRKRFLLVKSALRLSTDHTKSCFEKNLSIFYFKLPSLP